MADEVKTVNLSSDQTNNQLNNQPKKIWTRKNVIIAIFVIVIIALVYYFKCCKKAKTESVVASQTTTRDDIGGDFDIYDAVRKLMKKQSDYFKKSSSRIDI